MSPAHKNIRLIIHVVTSYHGIIHHQTHHEKYSCINKLLVRKTAILNIIKTFKLPSLVYTVRSIARALCLQLQHVRQSGTYYYCSTQLGSCTTRSDIVDRLLNTPTNSTQKHKHFRSANPITQHTKDNGYFNQPTNLSAAQ
jgi:hypothetical protein